MRQYHRGHVAATTVGDVDVHRWDGFPGADRLPFGAMWYVVPPGATSEPDRHPEVELSLVVSGAATVRVSDGSYQVPAGAAFLLDSHEEHVVHNPSDTLPLVVFSAYWMPTVDGTEG